jgi:hypothetical protein
MFGNTHRHRPEHQGNHSNQIANAEAVGSIALAWAGVEASVSPAATIISFVLAVALGADAIRRGERPRP